MPLLNRRLICAAEMLGTRKAVADIGTDHAFLPVYLIRNRLAERVIACDIAPGPLASAQTNIRKYGLSGQIELRMADGLDGVRPQECDSVTITGMGGETIADIIRRAEWLRQGKHLLVLQPMSCDDRLREALNQSGFSLLAERGVFSQGRVYTVMLARFTGKAPVTDCCFPYIGRLLEHPGDAEIAFATRRLHSMRRCMEEIRAVPRRRELYEKLERAAVQIEQRLAEQQAKG